MRYYFEGFMLDARLREMRNNGADCAVEPLVFDLLAHLIENRDRVVSREELLEAIWRGRHVSDTAISSCIKAARAALGDNGARQQMIRTVHGRGFRFVGAIVEAQSEPERLDADGTQGPTPDQEIRMSMSADGTRIAYALAGSGPPLVKSANWLNHLEFDWESPVWRHFFRELAAGHRLVRYDARGNGLSAWDVKDFSLDRQVEDLEAVVAATGLERFPLIGMSQGCAKAVVYAARHPERVTKLVLVGGYARGWQHRDDENSRAIGEARCTLIRTSWGADNRAIRDMLTATYMPDAPAESRDWFTELQRRTTTAENAEAILRAHGDVDVRALLPDVQAPTLVLHARDEVGVPYVLGHELAAGIRGARFASLDSKNHILTETEPAFARFTSEFRRFLAQ